MPVYNVKGTKYNIPDEKIEAFEKRYPDASVEIYDNDGVSYTLPLSKREAFKSKYNNWSYTPSAQEASSDSAKDEKPLPSYAKIPDSKPLTEEEKARFNSGAERIKSSVSNTQKQFSETADNIREYNKKGGLGQSVESEIEYSPEVGKFEKTYISPLGNRHNSKFAADSESRKVHEAVNMTIGNQLSKALKKREELEEQIKNEYAELDRKKYTNAGAFAGYRPPGIINATQHTAIGKEEGDRIKLLITALDETNSQIKTLEKEQDRKNGVDIGFWRSAMDVMGDYKTWTFGVGDIHNAVSKKNAIAILDNPNSSEEDRTIAQSVLDATIENQDAEELYGGNTTFRERAGMMFGHMPAFMLDFALTGGGFKALNVLGKAGVKKATKVVGEKAMKEMAEQGFKTYVKNNGISGLVNEATAWTIKALGTTADDLLIRAPLMTNTAQIGKVAADAMERAQGDVMVDENGNYDFSNDMSVGRAIWQAEANAIIENYSEMFGTHLDPVLSLKNIGKLANAVGAKRLSGLLAKADAQALDGIMGQTHKVFNTLGVGDYFGEVSEEYYGQLWRTMLNLDDAYQQNPDGSRTNLLASGQFHGDIWGGMALTMGVMGAAKSGITAANYAHLKHNVNKSDIKAKELFGDESWSSLKTIYDLTTNDKYGAIAESIVYDKEFTNEEKNAALTYLENSMILRGFNLGTMAESRNGEKSVDTEMANESYLDGYSATTPKEMNDSKNMLDYQRQRAAELLGDDMIAKLDADPIGELSSISQLYDDDAVDMARDYINAKYVYDGMIQRVRDDIDTRIEASGAMVDSRINKESGMIQAATMKVDDRKVYVVNGNVIPYSDGSGIDNESSDGSIIIRDAQTGALEFISPSDIFSIEKGQNPEIEKAIAAKAIREQFAQEAADMIDGTVRINIGDIYTMPVDNGTPIDVQVVANDLGVVDNGDGTINVSDGTSIFPMQKEEIQRQIDAANVARIAEFEAQRQAERAERKAIEKEKHPDYTANDDVIFSDKNGNIITGAVEEVTDDGVVIAIPDEISGLWRSKLYSRSELDNGLMKYNGKDISSPVSTYENEEIAEQLSKPPAAQELQDSGPAAEEQLQTAMQRIPVDEQGNLMYEQTDSDTAWDAILEQTDGDEVMAQSVAESMLADKEAQLKKIEKNKPKASDNASIAEKIIAEKEKKAAIEQAQAEVNAWKKIAQTPSRRKMAERDRINRELEAKAAADKALQEQLRAEQEEKERIEREALEGVPDIINDTPADARARGYRRVSGHQIIRQEPVNAVQGKNISVKFADDNIVNGHAVIIDAKALQPSHINGQRNAVHFIDEAQPKERKDDTSVLSAQKIASAIRPEEITSSVTAYTGAPTINTRGEVIQGNNRSAALLSMYAGFPEQAEKYKRYLQEHATEFGMRPADIESFEAPVLVNMLDVDDKTAIELGQYVAQDTESGGTERIKAKNAIQKMKEDVSLFARMLLQATDEETSFAGLVDNNGTDVLKWMSQKGYITPTQYKSAFDSRGNLSAEAKNDLKGIMYQNIFQNGSTQLEEIFNKVLPVKAQRAILATAHRDFDSPRSERMNAEIQNSMLAYYALSQDKAFIEATNLEDARRAVEAWKSQYQMDDVTGNSYLPSDNFSNFALHLAMMYKGENQSFLQETFNKMYDLIQGTQEETLFESPDNTPMTLAQAINETLNIEYNGQSRSNLLAGNNTASQREQSRSTGNTQGGKLTEVGTESTNNSGRTEGSSGQSEVGESKLFQYFAGSLSELIAHAKESAQGFIKKIIAPVSSRLKSDLSAQGIVIDDEYKHVIDNNAIRHTLNKHGNIREEKRGQIPITEADFERIPDIVENYDTIEIEKGKVNDVNIKYSKTYPDGTTIFIEEKRNKRKELAAISMWKMKNPTLTDANRNNTTPISDLNRASDNKDTENSEDSNNLAEKSSTIQGLEPYSEDEIKQIIIDFIISKDIPIAIKDIKIEGSRTRYEAKEDSDLDIVVEYEGDMKEDSVFNLLHDNEDPLIIDGIPVDINPIRVEETGTIADHDRMTKEYLNEKKLSETIEEAEAEVNTNPTQAQKEAGNYKMGHIQVGTFNVTIENSKGSVRRGVGPDGKKWETTMNNTYGYIRGTEGVDGDHIDVFLSNDIDAWTGARVFVIDQYNPDGTFDEHKVMLGFNNQEEAEAAFLSNYDEEWASSRKLDGSAVLMDDFEKWINSSHRKTKPFSEYKSVKKEDALPVAAADKGYSIERRFHKKNNTDIYAVKFTEQMPRGRFMELKKRVKDFGGYYSSFGKGGFIFENEENANKFAQAVLDHSGEQLADAAPISLNDVRNTTSAIDKEFSWTEMKQNDAPENINPSGNKLVTDERYAELKKRMSAKLGQLNTGIDPELLAIGTEMAVYHIEKGARKFTNYARNMIADLGDVIRPYLKAFYNGARDLPELSESGLAGEMTSYEDVSRFDVANFDKSSVDAVQAAEMIVYEQEHLAEANKAKKEIISQRNNERRKENEQISTDTIAIASEAKSAAAKAESEIKAATTTAELENAISAIDKSITDIDNQLEKLGAERPEEEHSGRVILKDGREAVIAIVSKHGEQLSATNFSEPAISSYYGFHNGKMIEFKPEDIDTDATSALKAPVAESIAPKEPSLFKIGDRVLYKGEEATIHDIDGGFPVLDVGMAPLIYEKAQWADLNKIPQSAKSKQSKKTDRKKKSVSSQKEDTGSFGNLFNNDNNDGLQGNDAVRSGRMSADNRGHQEGLSGSSEENSGRGSEESRGLNGRGSESGNVDDRTLRPRLYDTLKEIALSERKNTNNNHSERGESHAPTSVDARIKANIKAIELAQQLISNDEKATPEQMSVLRKFSGWGGLGKMISDNTYNEQVRNLLSPAEYEQAVQSANSSFYTPTNIIDTLWDIAEQLGFKGGNILEGSAGIGNILAQMPTAVSERSDIHAIEIDQTAGSILSLLYPDAKVEIKGFEDTQILNSSIDLSITNVPFVTGLNVKDSSGDSDLSKKFRNIHDFCIAKNVRKLREGGIGIFITSSGTLDNSKKLRDWVTSAGSSDFVGAFRMHKNTFGGADVTSDIIVIRKRINGKKSPNAIDVSTNAGERSVMYDTGEKRKVKGEEVPIIKHLAMDYNRYFVEHPERMAGEMRFAFEMGDTYRPTSKALYPVKSKNQEQMLSDFVQSFNVEESVERQEDSAYDPMIQDISADGKKIGEMYVKDGQLVVAGVGGYYPLDVNSNKVKGHTKVECFNAYSAIKETLAEVLSYQTKNDSNAGLKPLLDKLNGAYDNFVSTYGHFNKNTAIAFLRNDVDYPNVFSLEKYEEIADSKGQKHQKFSKTDVFSRRVIDKEKQPTPTNVKDGIIASVFQFGRIDIPYIAQHLGEDPEAIRQDILDNKYGFENPTTGQIEVSYQYLSGNVREKLKQAQENNTNGKYDTNINALEDVLPMDIPAHLIDFTLGSSWLDSAIYEEYTLDRTGIKAKFIPTGGTWVMEEPYYVNNEKNRSMGVYSQLRHDTTFGHTLIAAAIQNRTITISQTVKRHHGTETIVDKEATQACSAKIDEFRQDFKEWARLKIQSDPELSERIQRVYNDTFNNYVPLSIPDDFVPKHFAGQVSKMNGKDFHLREHQAKAAIRATMQPLLLAHEVGTGKTYTLITIAMEMRRLGTARKPMIVVQNATVGQFVESAKELYPNAKILTIEEADRSEKGRKNFYAKIRYNDWDMIVVPQSTFEFIPDSEERQMAYIQDKIEEKMFVLDQMKEAGSDNNIFTRQAEKEIEKLQDELAQLTDVSTKKRSANEEKRRAISLQNAEVRALEMLDRRTDDNVENFEDMGIDALLVDEAHEYKHLGFATAMQRGVKGVDPSYSKKSQGVFLKTQAVLEKNNGRNVVFATGTPISNTAAEIWTFMRYLMPADTLQEYDIYYFDDFVRNFGNIQQMLEFTTSGKFKENNRFAGYINLPELVRIWSGVADTVLTKEAGEVQKKIPELETGKAQDLYLPQTKALRGIMKFVKAELQKYEEMSGKEKKENSHIPLTMYGIAKAAAVDARLVSEDAADDPNSKTNEAVRQVLRSLKETKGYKGAIAIFADNYQNKQTGFNIYDDIKGKLIGEGIPEEQIVVIRSGMSVKKKLDIFEKINNGEIRVVLGSTFTLGTGVNIQERLHTLIHLDAPNRPMDYTQRNGRILRQGNIHKDMNKPVRVLRFGVEDSLDVTAYQRLKTKGAIADSIMNGKQMMSDSMNNRVLEEEEDVFGDTVAQLSGSEYAMLKNNAEKNVRKYQSRKKQWEADQTYIHNAKPQLQGKIASDEKRRDKWNEALQMVRKAFPNGTFKKITAGKYTFTSIEDMADFISSYNKSINAEVKSMKEGGDGVQRRELTISVDGFDFNISTRLNKEMSQSGGQLFSEVHRTMTYSCPELGLEDVPVHQMLLRNAIEDITNNIITGKDFAEKTEAAERAISHNRSELEQLVSREGKPFEYEQELSKAKEQYAEFSELMKKEMAEKEAKYAEMDKSVEAASDLSTVEDEDSDTMYRIRYAPAPKKTGIGYKVFVLKNGKLYPPMVANPNGEATPMGVWLDADAAPIAGQSKTGRNQVKAGGKGTQGANGRLAYRPGWHLGEIPYAIQFNRMDEYGNKSLFPANFVWAEVEYAADVNYQEEAMSYGLNKNGKFQHSYAGLPRVPKNGSYRYRTNPNPETDPWIITGAMRVKRLLTPSEVDAIVEEHGREPQRRQSGAVTDAQINAINEDIKNIDTTHPSLLKRQMADRVRELADKLHLDNVEVVTHVSGLDGKKKNARGFYTKSTGKITIVIPNNTSIADAEQTLLHEAVAHYGLRKLFGEHFDTFLDNVFNNADESIRRKIVDIAVKNGWDFHKATEEYLAGLAEETDFKQVQKSGWWQKIKEFFSEMLHKLGFSDFRGATLNDNELRYILWRSYENLSSGRHENIFYEATDIAMQYNLNVGENAEEIFFREPDPEAHERVLARQNYERRVSTGMFQFKEALQDSMLGLEEAYKAILGKQFTTIEDVDGLENAYLGENRLSSINKAEADAFAHLLFKPMLDEVARLAKNSTEREELTDYLMAKHGIERNVVMAERDAQQAKKDGSKLSLDDLVKKYRQRDYAGLTALTGVESTSGAEKEAKIIVEQYESIHNTDKLWELINAINKATLSKSYESGMMSKETYESISKMYRHYIPLRGFDEKTSAEAYAYLSHKHSAFNAPIKKAQGRTSKADDPFANMQSMAESAIMQGNRNKLVKRRFLNFALNHPSNLISVSDLWIRFNEITNEWEPVFPNTIEVGDSAEVVEQKMEEFEKRMKELAKTNPDLYKKGNDAANIPYRVVESRDLQQHQILVKRNGRDYILTINGNPRAAQAINGQTNPDNDNNGAIGAALRAGERINRQLSAFYTTRNPDFIISNFMRDMLLANSMVWIKESPNYAMRFHRNYAAANPARMKILFTKYRNNTLNINNPVESMFYQFIMNGGETGYANIRDIEQHKNDISRELKKANGKIGVKRALSLLGERFDEYNRAIENCARFAAFMTSRQMGRNMDRAIYDAKEISVNFNKKGSGAKFFEAAGQKKIGNAAALVSGFGRSGYVFWNAAIQGTFGNFIKNAKKHPAKAMTATAVMFLLGAIIAGLGADDEEDNKNSYYNLPDYVRRTNILFRMGEHWISIPLPVEYRAVYGMGELMMSVLGGKEHLSGAEIAGEITAQVTQMLPIDFLEGGGGLNAFVPSAAKPIWEALVTETSWTGMPIYKDTHWNKHMPQWTKAFESADKDLVALARILNESTGGDKYTKGAIDINPAKIEYLLNGYFGGVSSTIERLKKTGEIIAGTREYDPRHIPLLNRIVKAGDETTEYRAVNNEYFRLKEEHDIIKQRLNKYENDTYNGIFDYAEKIDYLYNSPEYERMLIFEDYQSEIEYLYDELKYVFDEEERKQLEEEINLIKKEMIEEMNQTRK